MATRKSAGSTPRTTERASAGEAPARRPGRPAGGLSGPEQRDRLLDVAVELFARQGIVDTTLAAIAREAGVTPAMVHYYFKTREHLLDVLIDERFAPARAAVRSAFAEHADDPVAALTGIAERLVELAAKHPWLPSLWVREVISDAGLLRQRLLGRVKDAARREELECIVRWQQEGRLNPDLEPALVFTTLLGITLLPLAASAQWRADIARARIGSEDIARHAVALLTQGVGPRKSKR
jgi:AcrR family transcriptional regulator